MLSGILPVGLNLHPVEAKLRGDYIYRPVYGGIPPCTGFFIECRPVVLRRTGRHWELRLFRQFHELFNFGGVHLNAVTPEVAGCDVEASLLAEVFA